MNRTGKLALLALLLAGALLLSACAAPRNPLEAAAVTDLPDAPVLLPSQEEAQPLSRQQTAVLYYRFLDEPLLAQEYRTLTRLPNQPWELTLIAALLTGPGQQELTALFPAGTRVLSTSLQGRTLFVTLSADVLAAYPDEPANWRETDAWLAEAPLRRRLAMQSLIATVTENCDIDAVQILVSQGSGGSLRLKQNYFLDDAPDSELTGPLRRDSSLLLTADRTMETVFTCLRQRDWLRLWKYVAGGGGYDAFVAQMEGLPLLTAFSLSSGSLSADGRTMTYTADVTVSGSLLQSGRRSGCVTRLLRSGGLWKIPLSQLTAWAE